MLEQNNEEGEGGRKSVVKDMLLSVRRPVGMSSVSERTFPLQHTYESTHAHVAS